MDQESGFWDRETVVGTIEKNATERIAVRRVERRGRAYVDIRIEWRRQDGEEFFPSKKGVVIPEEALDDVLALLESARDEKAPRRDGRRRHTETGDGAASSE
ncbi:MAG: transcriptional coactivator p15/PC4 family protein [Limnochordaceae bacterium]|uniref:Transcriptional coactivator p15/PC4 family protein n=1 Tax=Carboxydichorda subterranea TaxID=3109565 RepID=A0ABZ1BTZ3_9FIRM|nr:transcriptional coactivator p15/PC4 family protein [Limnochorda sp. L945t]MBE3598611.1 transcriptional coactivator p15/PC4 family protein [Limnochordaceae bacterium]WRP16095.1 transcriptional coactivator p15/PC4 family protein [Limnochorda sp. L945t]